MTTGADQLASMLRDPKTREAAKKLIARAHAATFGSSEKSFRSKVLDLKTQAHIASVSS